jgi:hypothetical protein
MKSLKRRLKIHVGIAMVSFILAIIAAPNLWVVTFFFVLGLTHYAVALLFFKNYTCPNDDVYVSYDNED